jgi:CRP-like cAMP-binding protein
MASEDRGQALRAALEKALDKDKPKDVISAYKELAQLEPNDPRWPQRLGDYVLRRGSKPEAEAAYLKALDVLIRQGFLPRAVALAKLIVEINPARADVFGKLNQDAARSLRQGKPAPTPTAAPAPVRSVQAQERLSFVPGAPVPEAVAAARPLARAADAAVDEVRFEDLADIDLVEVDASDMSVIATASADAAPAPQDPGAALVARLSASALFAEVAPATLAALARSAQRIELKDGEVAVRKGAPADGLFVIAEGSARVELPGLSAGGVDLSSGQIFGEACLVRRGRRQADVKARGALVLLRIGVQDLRKILSEHKELSDLLFNLMAGRLVANLLQTSPLFSGFDMTQRQSIARLFEVRLSPAGTVLQAEGMRSDGLYIALMGEFETEEGGKTAALAPGSVFGYTSLLTMAPAPRTIRSSTEAVVLRMPAAKFATFADSYPPAFDYLIDLDAQPVAL